MGYEYLVRIDPEDEPITEERLERILELVPNYYARVQYPGNVAFEFRTSSRLPAVADKWPDVYVIGDGRDIVICQFGDYATTIQVLGTLVEVLTSESRVERVTVLKP